MLSAQRRYVLRNNNFLFAIYGEQQLRSEVKKDVEGTRVIMQGNRETRRRGPALDGKKELRRWRMR